MPDATPNSELIAACEYVRNMLLQEIPDGSDGSTTLAERLAGMGGVRALKLVTDALAHAKPESDRA